MTSFGGKETPTTLCAAFVSLCAFVVVFLPATEFTTEPQRTPRWHKEERSIEHWLNHAREAKRWIIVSNFETVF